ncbi:ArsR/SmtB family transcription factor [Kordiimonas pumila]|uniref:ArsR/SmtB family transcription factor n=1 Tax=Kordiimonas pumila TaxID=2161677 RepID=A0ABV7D7Q5_9PROT|nr:metalloregulator ArsR/SmtB family transcription factor [Kordiimonas pumila]
MEQLLLALRAIAETTRLRIVALLAKGELTVGEIVQILDQSQPRVSRHLKLMGEAHLLERVQEGTLVFYRLSEAGLSQELMNCVLSLVPADDAGFKADMVALDTIRAERVAWAQEYFRKNAESWDEIRSLYISESQVEEALLAMQGRKNINRMLDIGTGTGRMLDVFCPYVTHATGIDLSREMLAVARANMVEKGLANAQVRQGDMYSLGVEDNSQDLIVFHQVLHFALDPLAAIKEASRALSSDGCILIADFAPHEEEFLRIEHAHRRLGFADEEIVGLAKSAGLQLREIKHLDGGKLQVTLWCFTKRVGKE